MSNQRTQEIAELICAIVQAEARATDLEGLMGGIRSALSRVMDTTNFCVNQYDPEKDTSKFVYHADEKDSIEDYDREYFDRYCIDHVSQREGLTPEVIRTGKPILIRQQGDLPHYEIDIKIVGTPAKVWLGIPLKIKERVIGVLSVQSYSNPDLYGVRELEILTAVAGQIAVAIEHKRTEEVLKKNEEIKKTLFSIANAVNVTLKLKDLYQFIHMTLSRVMVLPNFYIALYDKEKELIKFPYVVDEIDNPDQHEFFVEAKTLKTFSLTLMVIETRKTLLINKKRIIQLCQESHKENWGPVAEVWFGVPLLIRNEVMGVMCAQSYDESFRFNENDLDILISVSDQVAIAIDRKRADEEAQKRADRLTMLNRIGKLASTARNLDQLMEGIYKEINQIFRPDCFFIGFIDVNGNELDLRFMIEDEKKQSGVKLPMGQGFCSKVIFEKKPLIILDYEKEQNFIPKPLSFGNPRPSLSWVGVPLIHDEQVIGIITLQSYKIRAWDEEDIQLFFTITDQITATIQKARLFEEAQRRAERLTVLNRVGVLAATARNLDQLLESLYDEIKDIFKAKTFFIAFYLRETDELEFRFLFKEGQKREVGTRPLGTGLSAKMIAEKKALIVNHYDRECRDLPQQILLPFSEQPAQSWIGIPLMFEGQLIGIANLQSHQPYAWNEEDQQFFFTLVDQISAMIAKARLYEAVQQELTERKKAEEAKKDLEMRLRQAQKMEAIGTLAGGIAHDFNNVLYPIIGFTEMSLDQVSPHSLIRKNLDEILIAAERAKDMVQQILAFSRQQEYHPHALKIQPILKEALKLIRTSIPSTISIVQNIPESCGPILADPSQIHQIIMNLCTNAYHAMRKLGGTLEVGLAEVEVGLAKTTKPVSLAPGLYVCLTVRDTGHGIDPFIMDRIFDPYFTTKPPGEGTGMGLAMVHGIVQSNGGEIAVTSQPGQGACFQIFLPRVMEREEQTHTMLPQCIPGRGERVLFVDDDQQIAHMLEQMLVSLGYQACVQTNSLDALAVFQADPDRFDLVITDQTMPGLTGFDLAKRMLAIRPGLPILLCTGYSDLVNDELIQAAGVRKFLYKPILKSDLAAVMRQLLDK